MTTSLLRPAALVAAALVLVSGSAYAGVGVGRSSVGSLQVKNGSLRSVDVKNGSLGSVDVKNGSLGSVDVKNGSLGSVDVNDGALGSVDVKDGSLGSVDVKDGSLQRGDLAVGAVPRVHTVIRSVPEGTTRVLDLPGFSRFDFSCSSTSVGVFVGFGESPVDLDGPHQQHGLALSDIADNNPVGGATITGAGGGVGFSSSGTSSPGSGILVRGDYWGRSGTLLAHGTIAWGFPGAPCLIRLQVVVEELAVPDPVRPPARALARGTAATCESSGSAYCVAPPA